MDQKKWERWVIQTATRWEDLADIVQDTGIEKIDRDHKRLIEYILDMGDVAVRAEGDNYDAKQLEQQTMLFNRFIGSIQQHFDAEESFINRYELPGKKNQIHQHDVIFKKFNRIFSDFKEGILSSFQSGRIDLIVALIDHINQFDTKTFTLENFLPVLKTAKEWEDVSEIIKATGVPFVDDEHKQLTLQIIDLKLFLSKISYEIKTEAQKRTLLALMDDLQQFAGFHFDNEIRFLEKYFLSTQNQEEQHVIFLSAVSEQKKKILEDSFDNMNAFVKFLFTWWVGHINGIDYIEFRFSRIAGPVFGQSRNSKDFQWMIRKTDIDQVDEEHIQLIELLMNLRSASTQKENDSDLKTELTKIYEFAELHFKNEEEIMRNLKLEGIEIHQETHGKLLQNIQEAIEHAVSGRSRLSPLFNKRLMTWWVEHTNGTDYDMFVLNKTLI